MINQQRISLTGNVVDMTEGSVIRHILIFAFPLLLGDIFQQLYNTVDTWVIGNYASDTAFAAVGSVSPVCNMLIKTFIGLSSGAGVIISQNYGAHKNDIVQKAAHTCVAMTLILAVSFTFIGIAITPAMLRMMKIPPGVFEKAQTYLVIYFAGMAGLMFYNMGAGILRAVGDSRRPFYYLVFAAVINTVLDLLFVLVFGMEVEGVAYATIIAQGISAIFIIRALLSSHSCVQIHIPRIRIHWQQLQDSLHIGIPTALQMAVACFSNVYVMSYINQFGQDCMSGWTVYGKIDQFLLLPMQTLGLAVMIFVGQNLGRGLEKRAKNGVKTAFLLTTATTIVIAVSVATFAPKIVTFFNDKPDIMPYGKLFLRLLIPCHVLCCVSEIIFYALRGSGNSRTPMFLLLGSYVGFRQIYLFVVSNYINNSIIPIVMGYPAGWLLCSSLAIIYYRNFHLSTRQLSLANSAG